MSDIIATIQLRADTSAQWALHNPTLKSNELGIETDTFTSSGGVKLYKIKLGDGVTTWNSLSYGNIGQFFAGGGSGSSVWGSIAGTLSNQTDLQTALNAKEPLKGADDNYVTDAQLVVIGNTSGTNTGNETAATIGTIVNAAINYATPLDVDKIGIWDTVNSLFKAVTWANIKATLKTYFDTIYTRSNLGIGSGYILVTSGTSFTTSANITTSTVFKITLIGSGGGGGGTAVSGQKGSGGGGGAACVVWISGLSPSTSYTCAIGTGGAGGTGAADGANGGDTTLTIGVTTYTAGGGQKGIGAINSAGGAGGTATNGTLNIPGQKGGDSAQLGSGASTDSPGGDAALGWGTGGTAVKNTTAGNPGLLYGGGGAGGANGNGGAGANGVIYAEYFN